MNAVAMIGNIRIMNMTMNTILIPSAPSTLHLFIQVQSFELFCEGVVDRFVFLLIFKVFIDRAFIHPASALFFAACFARRALFTVPASACEYLPVPFAAQHHFLFTFRSSCLCRLCHVFTVSSFLILARQHFAPFAILCMMLFSALLTCIISDIVTFIFFIAFFYFRSDFLSMLFHLSAEDIFFQMASGNILELLLPYGVCSSRSEGFPHQIQQLS